MSDQTISRSDRAKKRWESVSPEQRTVISQRRAVSTLISTWSSLPDEEKARVFETVLGLDTEVKFADFMTFCDGRKDVFPTRD